MTSTGAAGHRTRPAPKGSTSLAIDLQLQRRAGDAGGPAVVATDLDGTITYWNAAAERLFGWPASDLIGRHVSTIGAASERSLTSEQIQGGLTRLEPYAGEFVLHVEGRDPVPVLIATNPILDRGRPAGTVAVLLDVSDRVGAQHQANQRAAQITAVASVGQMAVDRANLSDLLDGALQVAVEALDADLGSAFLVEEDGDLRMLAAVGLPTDLIGTHRIPPGPYSLAGYTLERADPTVVDDLASETRFTPPPVLLAAGAVSGVTAVLRAEQRAEGVIAVYRTDPRPFEPGDVEVLQSIANVLGHAIERQRVQQALSHLAITDQLTGLPNRVLFVDRLQQTIAQLGSAAAGVLFVDLDGFQDTNDALGHAAGDQLLRAVAERLVAAVDEGDTVARFGGDEFAVLLERVSGPAEAVRRARALAEAVASRPFDVDGRATSSTVTIGVVVVRGEADPAEVLRDADAAMHRAKSRSRGSVELFDAELREAVLARLRLTEELEAACQAGQMVLHYQPEVWLDGRGEVWAEALVRWEHPERGLLAPGAFIDVAEETGLILELGNQVLVAAAQQLAAWLELGPGKAPTSVSVNVSARQLVDGDLVELVGDLLRSLRLPPGSLWIELTETAILTDPELAMAVVADLKRLGVGVAIDDFGTGYSSLTYARMLPIDAIKVDRSFVAGMLSDRRDEGIVRATISLARSFGILSVAEGVEEPAQLERLRGLGCHLAQGYLLCRPGPAADVEAWVQERALRPAPS
ncbi:MAG TPA: EAL domain-containing protein [Acidimicrobiales bacterium]|nr:EAL domain-containing protein [Acidimicrobiales bacterium]